VRGDFERFSLGHKLVDLQCLSAVSLDGEYVRGDVHTNTIEGAFGLFKRGLVGSFHQVSRKHLDRYLDEFEFRYNNRRNPYLFRDTLTRLVSKDPMSYEQLTA